mmetsp:Transcript_6343/g.11270  ORF Transcript_6343/g.11270 Transcript_6343/m.11270 type:complete len:252 (+) Transcript_6343:419-1174(+)
MNTIHRFHNIFPSAPLFLQVIARRLPPCRRLVDQSFSLSPLLLHIIVSHGPPPTVFEYNWPLIQSSLPPSPLLLRVILWKLTKFCISCPRRWLAKYPLSPAPLLLDIVVVLNKANPILVFMGFVFWRHSRLEHVPFTPPLLVLGKFLYGFCPLLICITCNIHYLANKIIHHCIDHRRLAPVVFAWLLCPIARLFYAARLVRPGITVCGVLTRCRVNLSGSRGHVFCIHLATGMYTRRVQATVWSPVDLGHN